MPNIPVLTDLITARRALTRVRDLTLWSGAEDVEVKIGQDTQEALIVTSPTTPTTGDLRALHRSRVSGSVTPLVLAVATPTGVILHGPDTDGQPSEPLQAEHAARVVNAYLAELTDAAARVRLASNLHAVSRSNELPGVTNEGLFATHYLETSVRRELHWDTAVAKATPLLAKRGGDLIGGLGFTSEPIGAGAQLLSTADDTARAVAVLIGKNESFDGGSNRLGSSPVQYGLAQATKQRVPWLVVLRDSQLRLYPVHPDVGVGRRSQAETFFELDLSVVDERTAGFLHLIFSQHALAEGGSVEAILEGSGRYATSLGERLRDRVYNHVVPGLATAVARELERIDPTATLDDAYRITLKILFRLLFQAYAEDQGLLPYGHNDRYTRNSLTTQANDLLDDPTREFSDESHSIWDDLQQVWAVIDTGNQAWDVPAYNGGLFGQDPNHHPDGHLIAQMKLADSAVGEALRHLLLDTTPDGGFGLVDFRSLSVREFGTIYEGLLESSLSRAEQNLTIDKQGAYLPAKKGDSVIVAEGVIYHHNSSGERKSTGSYFTPSFAVEHLLDRALDPTLDEHLERVRALVDEGKRSEAAAEFFDFRVADLAMGSGHFLVAAIDHIEVKMNAFLVDHPIPRVEDELTRLERAARTALGDAGRDITIERQTLLRRQIARRCIYGLDINEIAVELARVAIWIHTFVPGLPMSTLDHNLVCGNSLTGIGTMEEALQALEPNRKPGQPSLFSSQLEVELEAVKRLLVDAANSLEATKAEVVEAAGKHTEAQELAKQAKALMDAAVAIRLGLIAPSYSVDELVKEVGKASIQTVLAPLDAAHLPALFPEVMLRVRGGFDVLVGNPPWEELMADRLRFWIPYLPGLAGMKAKERDASIAELEKQQPDLATEFEGLIKAVADMRKAIHMGPYPGIGTGDIDLYKAFAWRNWLLLRESGRMGCVLPRSGLSAAGTSKWREAVLADGSFTDVVFLTNTGGWVFEGIDGRYTVALVSAGKNPDLPVGFSGPFFALSEFRIGRANPSSVPRSEFAEWSDSLSFPRVPDTNAGEILRKMKKHPRFDSAEGFEFRPVAELHATNEKKHFDTDLTRVDLEVPVLTGASFEIWAPDFGDPYGRADKRTIEQHLFAKAAKTTKHNSSAFNGLTLNSIDDHPIHRARIAFRDVTNSTNRRTAIFCLIPPGNALVNTAPYLLRRQGTERDEAHLLGIGSSIPFDWYARRWVELHLNFHVLSPMPMPRPGGGELRDRVIELSGLLAAVDERFADWAAAVGVKTGQLKNSDERADAIAELDALSALLYGLDWDDVKHIFETFHRGWNYADRLAAVKKHYRNWESKA